MRTDGVHKKVILDDGPCEFFLFGDICMRGAGEGNYDNDLSDNDVCVFNCIVKQKRMGSSWSR